MASLNITVIVVPVLTPVTPLLGVVETTVGLEVSAAGTVTTMVNAGKEVIARPSETLSTIPVWVAAVPVGGVPLARPVEGLTVSHEGSPDAEYVSTSPSGSKPVTWNE